VLTALANRAVIAVAVTAAPGAGGHGAAAFCAGHPVGDVAATVFLAQQVHLLHHPLDEDVALIVRAAADGIHLPPGVEQRLLGMLMLPAQGMLHQLPGAASHAGRSWVKHEVMSHLQNLGVCCQ
jgi:hypothetical protein